MTLINAVTSYSPFHCISAQSSESENIFMKNFTLFVKQFARRVCVRVFVKRLCACACSDYAKYHSEGEKNRLY